MKSFIKEMLIILIVAQLLLYFTTISWEIIGFFSLLTGVLLYEIKNKSSKDFNDFDDRYS